MRIKALSGATKEPVPDHSLPSELSCFSKCRSLSMETTIEFAVIGLNTLFHKSPTVPSNAHVVDTTNFQGPHPNRAQPQRDLPSTEFS